MRILELVSRPLSQLVAGDREIVINLLDSDFGFQLERNGWKPSTPRYAERWVERAFSEGRYLRRSEAQNVVEKITVNLSADSHDALSAKIRQLFDIANRARMYQTTDWYKTPVYLHAKLTDESHSRYALVRNLSVEFGQSLYAVPADPGNFIENIIITIEREPFWRDGIPGKLPTSAIPLRNTVNNGSTGITSTTPVDFTYISNQRYTPSNFYVLSYDASANQYATHTNPNTTTPVPVLSVVGSAPAVGDIFYIGANTPWYLFWAYRAVDGTPGLVTVVAEYWNGSAWTALPVAVNYTANGQFPVLDASNSSVGTFTFEPGNLTWSATTVNGIQAFFLRWRVTAVAGSPSGGSMLFRWPRSASDSVQFTIPRGDTSAMALLRITPLTAMLYTFPPTHVVVGLRSRYASSFRARLQCSDVAGFWTFANHVDASAVADVTYHLNTCVSISFATATDQQRCSWTFVPTYGYKLAGEYHVYLRVRQMGGAVGDISVGVSQYYGGGLIGAVGSAVPQFVSPVAHEILSIGKVAITPSLLEGETTSNSTAFYVNASRSAGAGTLCIYELILVPVDEWAGVVASPGNNQAIHTGGIDIDAGVLASGAIKYWIDSLANIGERISEFQMRGALPFFAPGKDCTLSFLFLTQSTIAGRTGYLALSGIAMRASLYAHQRYALLRGDA